MLVVIGSSLRLEFFASKLLPLVIGSIVFVLAIIGLAGEIMAGHSLEGATGPSSEGRVREKKFTGLREYSGISAWILGYSLSIYVVGLLIATLLFVGAYMKRYGSNWPETMITAVVFTVILYAVFDLAFNVELYKGQIIMWLGF
jgi:hypothetical protein